ncbi:MAG: glycosyl transferase, partial [Pseudomonas caspiana]
MSFWWGPAIVLLSVGLTWVLRRYALARSLMDIPNARSSHSLPTPRGGGVAIVLSFLLALLVIQTESPATWHATLALSGAGLAVAILGFLDDHGHIAARWRLLGHFSAAVWGLYWLGGLPPFSL